MNLAAITDPVIRHPRSLLTFRPNPLTHPTPATNATLLIAPRRRSRRSRSGRSTKRSRVATLRRDDHYDDCARIRRRKHAKGVHDGPIHGPSGPPDPKLAVRARAAHAEPDSGAAGGSRPGTPGESFGMKRAQAWELKEAAAN